jgi:hypothetical protein
VSHRSHPARSVPAWFWPAVRGAYGVALCCAPGPLLARAGGRPASPRARAVARVLGLRQLGQAALGAARPEPAALAAGAVVDLAHAASMVALAAADSRVRRICLLDGLVATGLAAAGIIARPGGGPPWTVA